MRSGCRCIRNFLTALLNSNFLSSVLSVIYRRLKARITNGLFIVKKSQDVWSRFQTAAMAITELSSIAMMYLMRYAPAYSWLD